ncbi:hypothetical protein [Chryseolinea soli]|uniref:Uncharacterized protein n=1 Tax=Chryseolinea soli TaxID=2321403 RepID=A0A385SKP4_9BACT|nr:hypothetical protein [Chryseolinea soli]AYB30505.1 hypothetical protein D4L85_07885 [Chryseolinea soli]
MTIETFIIILKITMVLHGLTIVLCFSYFKQRSLQIKFLGVNFLCLFLSYHSMGVFQLKGMEVNIPTNIEILTSFFSLTALYYVQFQKRYAAFFLTLVVLFTIFWFVNIFFIQKIYFNSYSASVFSFVIMAYSVIYFYRLMKDLPERHLQHVPMFWISTGLLVQGAAATFLYLFTAYLTKFFFNDVLIYWILHGLMGIVELVLIIIGISIDFKNVVTASGKLHMNVQKET